MDKFIEWVGTFHPASVHFPIALLTVALLSRLQGQRAQMREKHLPYGFISRYCLYFGTITACLAAALGWAFASPMGTETDLMFYHRWFGTAVALGSVVVVVLKERGWCYTIPLAILVLGVLLTGFLGGAMIYGLDQHSPP